MVEHCPGAQRNALAGAGVPLGVLEAGVPEGRLHIRGSGSGIK